MFICERPKTVSRGSGRACSPWRRAPGLAVTGVAGDLELDMPALSWPNALRHIYENSPQLKVARAEVLRDQITVQRRARTADPQRVSSRRIRLQLGGEPDDGGGPVRLEHPDLEPQSGDRARGHGRGDASQHEVTRLELWLRHKLAEVYARYETARTTVQVYRDESIPQSLEAYQLTFDGYQQRRVPWAAGRAQPRMYSDLIEEYIDDAARLASCRGRNQRHDALRWLVAA